MKVKTSELSGKALDWAVIKASNFPVMMHEGSFVSYDMEMDAYVIIQPSVAWSQCGAMISRFGMTITPASSDRTEWMARFSENEEMLDGFGSTPQIAICRAVVAAKLGDEVDIPDELMEVGE